MLITAKINDTQIVKLCDWNTQMFEMNLALKIQSDDLPAIKKIFTDVKKIEILIDEQIVATYTAYNTYREIQYLGDVYIAGEDKFTPALRVVLYKTDIAEQVKRLDEKINPVIDFDAMTVSEYKKYKLTQINEVCQSDIYAGEEIEINGNPRKFTFKLEDQMNLKNLFDIVSTFPDVQYLPYHVSAQSCEMFSRKDIIIIYLTLLIRLTKITTYCNQLNMYIRNLSSKEDLEKVTYGMELTGKYLTVYNDIILHSMTSMQSLFEKYLGASNGENTEEPNNPDDSEQTQNPEESKNPEDTDDTEDTDNVEGNTNSTDTDNTENIGNSEDTQNTEDIKNAEDTENMEEIRTPEDNENTNIPMSDTKNDESVSNSSEENTVMVDIIK